MIYPYERKIRIVTEYNSGTLSMVLLAKKYDIPSKSTIQYWVDIYNRFGKEGLKKNPPTAYSVQFKKDVLHYKKQTGSSYQKTAESFGILYASNVRTWDLIVQEKGIEGLKESKGPSTMPQKNKQPTNSKAISQDKKHIAELERENELLRLENSYLKKLEAFQEKRLPEKPKQKRRTDFIKKDLN